MRVCGSQQISWSLHPPHRWDWDLKISEFITGGVDVDPCTSELRVARGENCQDEGVDRELCDDEIELGRLDVELVELLR